MERWLRLVVESIHSSPVESVVFISGGASQALGWLMSVPGASNTILEAVVPYSRTSFVQLIGKNPSQFCSIKTTEDLALLAYNRALILSSPGARVIGVGFTGSLATSRPKLGNHRFHVSTRSSHELRGSTVTLSKGLRTREEEDALSSQFLIKAMADACNVEEPCSLTLSSSDALLEHTISFTEDEELEQLIRGEIRFKVYSFNKENQKASRKLILPGSFNPLHDGHLKLLEVAATLCGDCYPCFEISAVNADKPPLSVSQIKARVSQFERAGKTVIISNEPFFYKKAELFPGSAFVIGADTVPRLINPKYYGGDAEKMVEILERCKRTGSKFLVGGRTVGGEFKVLDDYDVPGTLREMFLPIPAGTFRMDISSTEIRNRRKNDF